MKGYTRIREDLFCVEDSCRVYIIRRGDRCILIDFGTGMVMKVLEELGIHKVEAVLMTHHHRDQGEGLSLAAQGGIPILVPETEYDLFAHANEMWQSREIFNNYNNRQDRFSILEWRSPCSPLPDTPPGPFPYWCPCRANKWPFAATFCALPESSGRWRLPSGAITAARASPTLCYLSWSCKGGASNGCFPPMERLCWHRSPSRRRWKS